MALTFTRADREAAEGIASDIWGNVFHRLDVEHHLDGDDAGKAARACRDAVMAVCLEAWGIESEEALPENSISENDPAR